MAVEAENEPVLAEGFRSEAEELRERPTIVFSAALILVSLLSTLFVSADSIQLERRLLVNLALGVVGLVSYACLPRWPWITRLLLVIGPSASLALYLPVTQNPTTLYVGVLIVTGNFAIDPRLGIAAAVLNTLSLVLQVPIGNTLLGALVLLWAAVGIEFVSSRALHTALDWSWNSQQRAMTLLSRLRSRQGELNRTIRAMDEANARLAVLNERLAEARRGAEQARQAKAMFAANVSHELRTPLNLIVGFTDVMYNTPYAYPEAVLPPEFVMDLGTVYANAQHLQRLVDDVLDLAQLDMADPSLDPVETDVEALVHDAVETVRALATVSGLNLVVEVEPGLPRVWVDRTRIKQVLLNLLSNAVRYTEQGTITVRAWLDEGQINCAVADTGPGIPEKDQSKLFQEFERISTGHTSPQRGFGLGLAISRRLVEAHGGRIWVESQVGQGSTFIFSLPVGDEAGISGLVAGRASAAKSSDERPAVLLLSRSLIAVRLFARHLRTFRCLVARDVAMAVHKIESLQPVGVLVDAAMGSTVVTEISQAIQRNSVANVPVIVCSMPGESQRRELAPIKGYLTKPVTRQDLLDTLRTLGTPLRTVLVVDDEEDVVRLLTHYLEDPVLGECTVLAAHNGREALDILENRAVDLILLDLIMPVMDGYRLLKELEGLPERGEIPVVVFSGQEPLAEHTSVKGHLRLTLAKPISADVLIRSIDDLLKAFQNPLPTHRAQPKPGARRRA